uniref:Uncharacterized protein n=1 Tax=uncultured prokaryote TaxID=198431 RepID=A0A0H5Q1L8_9ZZZZ|nr:hypothetical protein [uncultured prokaryote]
MAVSWQWNDVYASVVAESNNIYSMTCEYVAPEGSNIQRVITNGGVFFTYRDAGSLSGDPIWALVQSQFQLSTANGLRVYRTLRDKYNMITPYTQSTVVGLDYTRLAGAAEDLSLMDFDAQVRMAYLEYAPSVNASWTGSAFSNGSNQILPDQVVGSLTMSVLTSY